MNTTLQQVGELLLDAIPTVVLLLALYAVYQNVVRRPLERMLNERRERTEGAAQKARSDVASAEARTQEYEQKLRDARTAVFKAQEARRQQAQQMRTKVLDEARAQAQQQIQAARAAVQQDMAEARTGLQAESQRLATEIIRTILKPAQAPMAGGVE